MAAEYRNRDPFASPTFDALRKFVLEAHGTGADACGGFEQFERELHQRVMAIEADLVAQQLAHYDVEAEEVEVRGSRSASR